MSELAGKYPDLVLLGALRSVLETQLLSRAALLHTEQWCPECSSPSEQTDIRQASQSPAAGDGASPALLQRAAGLLTAQLNGAELE